MNIEWVRDYCLSLPHATEELQWGESLLFKIGGKIFAILNLQEERENRLSIKSTAERAAELVEVEGIIPAPYLARNHWVCFQDLQALRRTEVKELIRHSYELVWEKLPKKKKSALPWRPAEL